MKINGLEFVFESIREMSEGICAGCHHPLPPLHQRDFQFTCDAVCHAAWVEALVARFGETRDVTDGDTGKVYVVPTRVILEHGLSHAQLKAFPERTP